MNSEWQQFLVQQGAIIEQHALSGFTPSTPEQQPGGDTRILTDLSHYGLLAVSGDDAAGFLQSQFSNDAKQLNQGNSQLSSYCTAKGRMLAIFRLSQKDDTYYLRCPLALQASLSKRLQMFILMSKVKLDDASQRLQRIGVAGAGTADLLQSHLGDVPAAVNAVVSTDDYHVLCLPGTERFEIYAALEPAKALWSSLETECEPAAHERWPLLDILAGIPTVYPETSEAFVPQMTNLQLVDGVSFKKGCYPGQEVVARMQYRGTLKRRMHLFSLATAQAPAPGSSVISVTDGKAHAAGQVVDARPSGEHQCMGLAVLEISKLDQPLHIGDENGPRLQLRSLPYAFGPD